MKKVWEIMLAKDPFMPRNPSISERLLIISSFLFKTVYDKHGRPKQIRNKINGRVVLSFKDAWRALGFK